MLLFTILLFIVIIFNNTNDRIRIQLKYELSYKIESSTQFMKGFDLKACLHISLHICILPSLIHIFPPKIRSLYTQKTFIIGMKDFHDCSWQTTKWIRVSKVGLPMPLNWEFLTSVSLSNSVPLSSFSMPLSLLRQPYSLTLAPSRDLLEVDQELLSFLPWHQGDAHVNPPQHCWHTTEAIYCEFVLA